ncbi:MAG: hypothetical protein ACKOA8_06310 [Deltaproteobacteria bacterium]
MRYRAQSFTFLAIGTILMIGCGSPQTIKPIDITTTSKKTQSDAPSWIDNPPGVLSAIGIEGRNPLGDIMYQREMAINAARVQLGRTFKLHVKGLIERTMNDSRMASNNNTNTSSLNAKIGSSSSVLDGAMVSIRKMVDETIVDTDLSGAAARQFWTDKETGTLYVLVQIDEEGAFAKIQAAARAALEKERILAEKDRMDKVLAQDMKLLDERIQKTKELPPASSIKEEGSQN